jgi:hypothetical protein
MNILCQRYAEKISMLSTVALWLCIVISCKKDVAPLSQEPGSRPDTTVPATPGREFVLTPDGEGHLVIDGKKHKYEPGDVLRLKGNFSGITISNLSGSAAAPIYIKNVAGAVTTVGNPNWNGGSWAGGLAFGNCHHIVLGGEKDRSSFVINGSTQPRREAYFNLVLADHTDNFEIRNMTIRNGGTGIWAKTDPKKGDASTWYPNSQMQNLSIHNVEIDGTNNEAMYIGHTATYWDLTAQAPHYAAPADFAKGHDYVQPIKWQRVKIYDNYVHNIGADGIQTAAIDQLEIYSNEVTDWGKQHNSAHNGGILIGGRTTNTNTYDNYVHDGWGELCQFYGSGENGGTHIIHNNLFRDNQDQHDGVSLRGTEGATVKVTNNTIARTGGVCLRLNGFSGMTGAVAVQENAFIQPRAAGGAVFDNAYVYTENGAAASEGKGNKANTKFPTVKAARVDADNYYKPLNGSPLLFTGYRKKK